MAIKAAIFDLDGTLLDTLKDLASAMNAMLRSLGYPERTLSHHREAVGDGVRVYVTRCLPEQVQGDEAVIDEAVKRMRQNYLTAWNVATKPYDGITTLLDGLQKTGVALAVLTNKMHDVACDMMAHWLSDYPFHPIYGERSGKPRKPDPTVPREIAAELGVKPEECAFIGDSRFDVQTGVNAGMLPLGANWGYASREELMQNGAAFVADTPVELLTYLKSEQLI